jgi:hypothetical protein
MDNFREHKISLPDGSNAVAVDVADHSFVTILRNGREVVTDRGDASSHRFLLPPGDYVVRTDGELGKVVASKLALPGPRVGDLLRAQARAGTLRITAAAPQVHPVDQIGQLPADGKSTVAITVERVDAEGEIVTDASDVVYLRTTGGRLVSDAGAPTSQVQLQAGIASFQLVAEAAPRFITILVFGASPTLRAELPFEFVLPDSQPARGAAPPQHSERVAREVEPRPARRRQAR